MSKSPHWILLAAIGFAFWSEPGQQASAQGISFKAATYQRDWEAGTIDHDGRRMNGTEIIQIVAHKGKLFAATSMWKETDRGLGGAQVLVLDDANAKWRLDHQFARGHRRLTSIKSVTFRTDANGQRVPPETILLAAPTTRRRDEVRIYARNDRTGNWDAMRLGQAPGASQTRGIGFYRDSVSGIDYVFAGVSGTRRSPASLGVLRGAYNPAVAGRIGWHRTAEIIMPATERVMGFAACNGAFYLSSSRNIFRRIDGRLPKWVSIFDDPDLNAPVGVRGLTCVPNPMGKGEVLLFVTKAKLRRLDPPTITASPRNWTYPPS